MIQVVDSFRRRLNWKHSRCAAAGQSVVEFALLLPLLLLLVIGVVDLGRVYFSYITVTNAAREGARYGAARPTETSQIINRAINEAQGSGVILTNVSVSCPNGSCTQGNPIQVTVSYNFQLITAYLFGGGTIPLQASVQMEIFGQ